MPWYPSTTFAHRAPLIATKRRSETDRAQANPLEKHPRCSSMVALRLSSLLRRFARFCAFLFSGLAEPFSTSPAQLSLGGSNSPRAFLLPRTSANSLPLAVARTGSARESARCSNRQPGFESKAHVGQLLAGRRRWRVGTSRIADVTLDTVCCGPARSAEQDCWKLVSYPHPSGYIDYPKAAIVAIHSIFHDSCSQRNRCRKVEIYQPENVGWRRMRGEGQMMDRFKSRWLFRAIGVLIFAFICQSGDP